MQKEIATSLDIDIGESGGGTLASQYIKLAGGRGE